jgi:hypothetical protein
LFIEKDLDKTQTTKKNDYKLELSMVNYLSILYYGNANVPMHVDDIRRTESEIYV